MTDAPVVLRCQCCQFEMTFLSAEAARDAGWDCAPHVANWVCCDLCPSSLLALGRTDRHAAAHARWAVYGRPESFIEQFRWGDLPTNPE